jgi:hypothetical protein
VPFGQGVQVAADDALLKDPGGHCKHLAFAARFEKLPGLQGLQDIVFFEYDPGPHCTYELAPDPGTTQPAGGERHPVAPENGMYVPQLHGSHELITFCPRMKVVVEEKFPGGHGVHCRCPDEDANVPNGHDGHWAYFMSLTYTCVVVLLWFVPGLHGKH